jgi:hypothetical protein
VHSPSDLMKRLALATILLQSGIACAAQRSVSLKAVVGAWQAVGQWAFFEQVSFESTGSEQTFYAWLHERPDWRFAMRVVGLRDAMSPPLTLSSCVAGPC